MSDERLIVREPNGTTAGVAVARTDDPNPNTTRYRVEQLWPDGDADPVYVGDREDVLRLINALSEAMLDAE